jgi:D-glycero-D-manno-heptose 1,7-bisphosphate phosphatase
MGIRSPEDHHRRSVVLIPAVFLDRDGVLNEPVVRGGKPYPPASAAEMLITSDVPAAVARLKSLGLPLIVVTNQPDVARGTQTKEAVEAIHDRLRRELGIDAFVTCFHDDRDHCPCRKPKPGLIFEGAKRYGADPARSFLIGDRWRDIEAGRAAGCRTIWIDRGYQERTPNGSDVRVESLTEAAEWIAQQIESNDMHAHA